MKTVNNSGSENICPAESKSPVLPRESKINIELAMMAAQMAEESLKTSETRYRRLFESAKDGILILDAETGMIIDVNPFLIEMLGFTEKQFLKKAIWEIGFFRDLVESKEKFIELQQTEYVRYENLPLETVNGRKFNVEFVSNVYEENNKNVIQCNIRDITLRKKAETAHHQSEEKFRLIMENSSEAIFMLDHQGGYLNSNKAFTDMLGYTEEEIKQKSITDLISKKKAKNFPDLFDEVLKNGKIFAEIKLVKKNGNRILTELSSVLLPNGLVYCSCKDITLSREVKRLLKQKSRQLRNQIKEYQHLNKLLVLSNEQLIFAKRKAEENDNLKTAFLQNMSHEIRTPMNGILGFSELLKNPQLSDEEQQKYIRIIEQSGLRMLNIITDIVNISKIETGQ
ncbi:MAG TPA: PAS domain S-box protein, partial [Prolixibacteraceae bacterium]|nr:PAS domain S-box protein [Prolixibacteraceae bacterium]